MSLTVEESNFLRFYYLNLKIATKAVRVYFDFVHPPAGLANELANNSATLKGLRFITKQQLHILYPSPASNVKSEDFDTTLIVCLLRNMTPRENAPVTGWDNLPHPGDTSKGADLARVKWYRNKLAHDGDGILSPTNFSHDWIDLECTIGRLGGPSLMKEAQSVHHIVLDKSITDMLKGLRNCEKEVNNLKMSQESTTSKINDHTLAIYNQGMIKQEHENRIQELTIKFKEIEQKLTTHNEQMATCEKNVENLKRKQKDSDDSSVASKRKRLEDDTKVLIEEDVNEGTFVTTKAVTEGLLMLNQNGVLLITGHAGTGKSRIGRHILNLFCIENSSYKSIKLNTLAEWENMVNREDNVLVLLDDIFGVTNCIFNKEKDTQMLDKISAYVGHGKIKIIITIRDTVKRQCQDVFDSHRLFKYDFIDLSSDKFVLSSEEKYTFLRTYMKRVRQSDYEEAAGFVNCNGVNTLKSEEVFEIITENPVKGFPLAMYQFVHNDKFFHLGRKFFDRPTVALLDEMNEIRRKGKKDTEFRIQYAVMVYTAINGNCIDLDERLNGIIVRRLMRAIFGKSYTVKTCSILDAVAELKGSYLVTFSNERFYRFHHQSLLECVILSFAQVDEEYIERIIPFLSWSFFLKMVKSDAYTQKEGEIVLKIPPSSYKTLADRLVEIYLVDFRNKIFNVYCFLAELVDTEVFQHKPKLLLSYLLKAFETEDSKDEQNENFSKTSEYIEKSLTQTYNRCDEHMTSKFFFLGYLLGTIAIKERQLKVYDLILKKCHQILNTSNNFVIIDFMKAALIRSLYEICSSKDLGCVKATLNLVHKHKIAVVRDQYTNLTTVRLYTAFGNGSSYNYNDIRCVFLTFCIWKAYAAMNKPVLRYLLSLYSDIPFDVNLFLRKIYCPSWLKELNSLSYKPLKWIIERFENQEIVETDFLLSSACQFQMFGTVEYLLNKCKTVDAISCIKMYLNGDGKNDSDFYFNEDFFNFLFSKIDIDNTSSEMIAIVISTLQKPCVPDSVCETLLPVCIDNKDILTVACIEAHFYLTKLILEHSHNVNIQSALLSACSKKTMNVINALEIATEKLKIVNFIVLKYGTDQVDLKVVCQEAFKCRLFKIVHLFTQKFDITRLDVHCIINFSLMCGWSEILQNVIDTIDITGLDKLEVLRSLSEHYSVGCSSKILHIVSVIWDSTKDMAELKMEEILDMAYQKRCFELLQWIHENCNLHVSIDAKKVLILACADGRIDVAKWILTSFENASFDIEDLNLFMLACDDGRHRAFVQTLLDIRDGDLAMLVCNKVSHFKYQARKIDMVRWFIESFQIKPLDIKLGVFTLIHHKKYNNLEIGEAFFKLGVFLLNKHFTCLSTEDKEELMTSFLHQKYYDVVNWLLEDKGFDPFDKQQVLNKACSDGQIKTIQLLKDYFYSLDMNEAIICAFIGYTSDQISFCEYLWSEIDKRALNLSKIVNTVCKEKVSDNVLTWILIKFQNYQIANKVLIHCCQEGKFNLLKHILITVDDDKLDILSAFRTACLQPNDWTVNFKEHLCIVDILFQKIQNKAHSLTEVLNGLLENKSYALLLYFLEEGYCMDLNQKNLMNEVCRHGHVKLLQWILENVKHEELDIKSAFRAVCKNVDYEWQLQCLALMWHYIPNKDLFELDSVLNDITETPPDSPNKYDDLRNWLLYTKNTNQRMMSESGLKSEEVKI